MSLWFLIGSAWAMDWVTARPLTLPATVLRAEADLCGDTPGVHMLLDDIQISLSSDGRQVRQRHGIAVVHGKDAVDRLSSLRFRWDGEDERPQIELRVLQADGDEYRGDGSTFTEDGGSTDTRAGIYSDDRTLVGPTPGLEDGSILEMWVVERGAAPLGGRDDGLIDLQSTARHGRRELAAPVGVAVQHTLRGGELPAPTRRRGAQVWTLRWDRPEDVITGVDGKGALWAWTTWSSWVEVVAAWEAIAQPLMRSSAIEELLTEIPAGLTPGETANRALDVLDRRVRYRGLELGEHGLIPYDPAEVLRRGYGDCKDQAVILAALLRARGIDADVVLLHASASPWPELMLPGFGRFNHAIVHAGGPEEMWIDPTARAAAPGALPRVDQDRPALLIRADSAGLVYTPVQPSFIIEHTMVDHRGLEADFVWRTEYGGSRMITERAWFSGHDPVQRMRSRGISEKTVDLARAVFGVEGLERDAGALREHTELRFTQYGRLQPGGVSGRVMEGRFFDLLRSSLEEGVVEHAPPVGPVEMVQRSVLPSGFSRAPSPERSQPLGTGVVSWSVRQVDDHTWEDVLRFVPGTTRPTAADVANVKSIAEQWSAQLQRVRYDAPWRDAVEAGRWADARRAAEQAMAAAPADGGLRVHWAWTLHQLGLDGPAEVLLRGWLALHPEDREAWSVLAWVEAMAPDGRSGSEERLPDVLEAVEHAPPWAVEAAVRLFPLSRRPADPGTLERFAALRRRAAEQHGNWQGWAELMIRLGHPEQVLELPVDLLDTEAEAIERTHALLRAGRDDELRREVARELSEGGQDVLMGMMVLFGWEGRADLLQETAGLLGKPAMAEALLKSLSLGIELDRGAQKGAFEALVAMYRAAHEGDRDDLARQLAQVAHGVDAARLADEVSVVWSPADPGPTMRARSRLMRAERVYESESLVILRGPDEKDGRRGLLLPLVREEAGWWLGAPPDMVVSVCGLAWDVLEAGDEAGALALLTHIRRTAPKPIDPTLEPDVDRRVRLYSGLPWARDHHAAAPAPLEGEYLRWQVMLEAAEGGAWQAMQAAEAMLPGLAPERVMATQDALALGYRAREEHLRVVEVLAGRSDVRARLMRATMLTRLGRLAEARAELGAVPRDPSDPALLAARGVALGGLGEHVAAARELREAARGQNVPDSFRLVAARAALRAGDPEGALDLAARAGADEDEAGTIVRVLGWQRTGRWKEAAEVAMAWSARRSKPEWALVGIGFARALGYADAAAALERAAEAPETIDSLMAEIKPVKR